MAAYRKRRESHAAKYESWLAKTRNASAEINQWPAGPISAETGVMAIQLMKAKYNQLGGSLQKNIAATMAAIATMAKTGKAAR